MCVLFTMQFSTDCARTLNWITKDHPEDLSVDRLQCILSWAKNEAYVLFSSICCLGLNHSFHNTVFKFVFVFNQLTPFV